MDTKQIYKIMTIGLVTFTASIINIFLGICIMVKGWGVSIQSYGWIIGGGLFVAFIAWMLASVMAIIIGDIKDDV